MASGRPAGCLPCALEDQDDDLVVFRDGLWAAEVAPGWEVPGWFFLRVRRHAERLSGLDDAEADGFGRRARDLVAAVDEVMGTSVTYMVSYGENHPHFHALIIPRGDSVPAENRGGGVMTLAASQADAEVARTVAGQVADVYARRVAPRRHRQSP